MSYAVTDPVAPITLSEMRDAWASCGLGSREEFDGIVAVVNAVLDQREAAKTRPVEKARSSGVAKAGRSRRERARTAGRGR